MATTAGTAYCTSSFRIRSVPSSIAADLSSVVGIIPLSFSPYRGTARSSRPNHSP